jgi:methionine-rich copper-binding protein CopC
MLLGRNVPCIVAYKMSKPILRLHIGAICRRCILWALLWSLVAGVLGAASAGAHASLERAEPPMDGLVIASPPQLRLFFTEEVAADNPAPSIQLLNEAGEPQDVQIHPLGGEGDARTVIADLEPL